MKDIDLVKLKADISARKGMPDFSAHHNAPFERMKTINETMSSFTPDVVESLIEQLEAAQHERDEWIEQSRANTFLYAAMKARAELAEAELKRRDAQEPVGWQFKSVNGDWLGLLNWDGKNYAIKEGCEVRPVYADAPAAVLPPEVSASDAECSMSPERAEAWASGANWMREQVLNYPVIPDGWKLVPIELTREMQSAWDSAPNCNGDNEDENMCKAYRAMIAAAPKPE